MKEEKWRAECDADTLTSYSKIKNDKKRYDNAKKILEQRAKEAKETLIDTV